MNAWLRRKGISGSLPAIRDPAPKPLKIPPLYNKRPVSNPDLDGRISLPASTGDDPTTRSTLRNPDADNLAPALKALILELPDIVAILDAGGEVVFLNRAGERAWGPLEEAPERFHLGHLFPDHALNRVRQEALPTASARGVWQGHAAYRTREGNECPAHLWLRTHTDGDGRISHFCALLRDSSPTSQADGQTGTGPAGDPCPAALRNKLAIPQGQDQLVLDTDAIVYLKAEGHYTWVQGADHSHLTSRSLGQLEACLDPQRFFRTHRSYIINLAYLTVIERVDNHHRVRLRNVDNEGIPVSRKRLQQLQAYLNAG